MKTQLSLFALATLLATAAPLVAQETTEAPATEAPADGTAATSEFPVGTDVNATPTVGQSYTAATFEAWEQRCVKTELSADPCELYQLLKDKEGNSVAEFSIFSLPKGTQGPAVVGGTFVAPLETLLTAGLTIQVDTGEPRAYPFTLCTAAGCVARIGLTAEEVAQMKKGANAVLTIVPFVAPDQKVALTASLKGFTAGLDAVNAANDASDAAAAAAAEAAKAAAPAEGTTEAAPEN